jgi:HEAT repeat protein
VAAFAEPCTQVELRRRLAGLPAEELAGLFRCAAEGLVPTAEGEARPMGAEWRRVLRESLATRPRRELVPFLEDRAAEGLSDNECLEAQLLLGAMGSADHLKLLVRVTAARPTGEGLPPELRTGFESALAALLARDPSGMTRLPALFVESPAALGSAIAGALGRQPSAQATAVLAGLLGRKPGLDPLLLLRLAERGRPGVREVGDVLERVRTYLGESDPSLLCAAIQALGRLGDEDSVEALIALLRRDDARVRASAIDALSRLTGLGHGSDPRRWAAWFEAESLWWERDASALLVHVERGRGLEFVRASRETLEHRLFPGRIARAFAQALGRAQAEEAELACQALARLRSPAGVPALVEALDHRDARVRNAAWKALRDITGVELPPDPTAWAALDG